MKLFECNSEIATLLKKDYPNLVSNVCAAFGVSHVFYEDETYTNKVAESLYTDVPNSISFLGCFLKLQRYDHNRINRTKSQAT